MNNKLSENLCVLIFANIRFEDIKSEITSCKFAGKEAILYLIDVILECHIENIFIVIYANLDKLIKKIKDYIGNRARITFILDYEEHKNDFYFLQEVLNLIEDKTTSLAIVPIDCFIFNSDVLINLIDSVNYQNNFGDTYAMSILGVNLSEKNFRNHTLNFERIVSLPGEDIALRIIPKSISGFEDSTFAFLGPMCSCVFLLNNMIEYASQSKINRNVADIVATVTFFGLNTYISKITYDDNGVYKLNSFSSMNKVEHIVQNKLKFKALQKGAIFLNLSSTIMYFDTIIENESIIPACVVFGENVHIGKNANIKPFSYLENCKIGVDE